MVLAPSVLSPKPRRPGSAAATPAPAGRAGSTRASGETARRRRPDALSARRLGDVLEAPLHGRRRPRRPALAPGRGRPRRRAGGPAVAREGRAGLRRRDRDRPNAGGSTSGRPQPAAPRAESGPREHDGRSMPKKTFGVELHEYLDGGDHPGGGPARRALGYDSLWLGDSQLIWREMYALMGVAAATTSRIAPRHRGHQPGHPPRHRRAPAPWRRCRSCRTAACHGRAASASPRCNTAGLPTATRAELSRIVRTVRALCNGERDPRPRAATCGWRSRATE